MKLVDLPLINLSKKESFENNLCNMIFKIFIEAVLILTLIACKNHASNVDMQPP